MNMGKSSISTGPFSIAMLVYQRVIVRVCQGLVSSLESSEPKQQKLELWRETEEAVTVRKPTESGSALTVSNYLNYLLDHFWIIYPLVHVYIANWKITILKK